jgi:thioesterase domain-containing protein/acyl carrier protein
MVPGRYVPLEKLPLNINGKLDRKALTEPEFTRSESYVAPRNELEGQICRIWAEVLGLPEDKIGIQDDFFNLGGHSLSALKTLSLIKNFFLIKLPTRTLFDYPTIEKLAELIHKTQQTLTINTQQSAMTSPIIALQENGFKAPLFLIHPIGGTIFWYKALSRYLGLYRSIYAIQDPGIDADDLLFKNIQEMASFYLKAIQKIQPSGPYLLAGASFGATVSIEIANQLLKAGERVNFIGLLDGWPIYSKKFWEKEFFEQLMLQQFERMDLQFISQGINDFQFLLKLQQHRMSMLRDYKIPLVKSKLTFFKAEELWPVFKEMVLPLNCWQPFSTQPVDFHLVPGNHETMFWEPNVQELANKMNEAFSKFEIHKQSQQLPLKIQGA